MRRPSRLRRTCVAYFSVASRYARGHSMRFGSTTVMGQLWRIHHARPGETRSFTLSTSCAVMTSPGATSAAAGVASMAAKSAVSQQARVVMAQPPEVSLLNDGIVPVGSAGPRGGQHAIAPRPLSDPAGAYPVLRWPAAPYAGAARLERG